MMYQAFPQSSPSLSSTAMPGVSMSDSIIQPTANPHHLLQSSQQGQFKTTFRSLSCRQFLWDNGGSKEKSNVDPISSLSTGPPQSLTVSVSTSRDRNIQQKLTEQPSS
ncbi:hypothetical protein KC19_11G112600 [Ceratodon purpureus]|uniref:Uncharacterized protein n=1 Tax=Ceratodon purpureus TaxID=3225 RepID=A0A8T0GHJ3_CERPU|nr:hypothetical protein KC19_11G112600 [Ceratodon purpureus]